MDIRSLSPVDFCALLRREGIQRCYLVWDPDAGLFSRARDNNSLIQSYHFLLIMEGTGKVTGWVIFPRDPQRRSRSGGLADVGFVDSEKLLEAIHRHRDHLTAL